MIAFEATDAWMDKGWLRRLAMGLKVRRSSSAITAELDVTGDGAWCAYARYAVSAGAPVRVEWPRALSAYWVRFVADTDCVPSAQLVYR